MGLVKDKKVLLESDFARDPLQARNLQLSAVNRVTMPALADDVMHDKHQPVFWSLNYVLEKLVDNDKFIQQYADSLKTKVQGIPESRLTSAFAYADSYPSDISKFAIYDDMLAAHCEAYHRNIDYGKVNEDYLHSDCQNFDAAGAQQSFQHSSPANRHVHEVPAITLSNDVLIELECDDSPTVRRATNYVKVSACNKNTGNIFRSVLTNQVDLMNPIPATTESTYIYKRWLSGLKELYVYIPTTFTFYNETPSGMVPDVKSNVTYVRLQINKRHFQFNHIYNVQVCGQSLPLQIHADAVKHFSDTVQPSLVRSMFISTKSDENVSCNYDDVTNMYTFYFCVYGTDAQAVKLIGD